MPQMTTRPDRWDGILLNCTLATMSEGLGYGLVEDGALGWQDGRLVYAGARDDLPAAAADLAMQVIDGQGDCVTPALVDCHSHLVFAGNRAAEFERRLHGASYEDIAREGGGILSTVRQVRSASEVELLDQSLPRAEALVADGVASLEIKSGYGLDLENERKMLRVAREIGSRLGITVRTTYLAAHSLPPEFSGRADDYIDAACRWMAQLHREGLVDAVDAFCEGIAFSPAQTRRVFEAARSLGLPVKLHADQLSNLEGATLVAEFGGLSADHLEYASAEAISAMAAAGTVAVLLPGAFHVLRETRQPPIQALRDARVPMAVASDLNPGTSPLQSLRLAMSLACTHFKLTPEEALRGATVNAAKALGLLDRGKLEAGLRADFARWRISHPAELSYWLGGNLLRQLVVAGKPLA